MLLSATKTSMYVEENFLFVQVDVGDFLRLKSCVLYTETENLEQPHIHVEVIAHVTQPELKSSEVFFTAPWEPWTPLLLKVHMQCKKCTWYKTLIIYLGCKSYKASDGQPFYHVVFGFVIINWKKTDDHHLFIMQLYK